MDDINMKAKDLKRILVDIPDDMDVIIPISNEDNANYIFGFRHVRTAGILENRYEDSPALCLSASEGIDISTQITIHNDGMTTCTKVLF